MELKQEPRIMVPHLRLSEAKARELNSAPPDSARKAVTQVRILVGLLDSTVAGSKTRRWFSVRILVGLLEDFEFDFYVSDGQRGRNINLFPTKKIIDYQTILRIPRNAYFILVNPINEDEFIECPDLSDKQEIYYFDSQRKFIGGQCFDDKSTTYKLMDAMEKIFRKVEL
jgi:hypothetical protein